MPVQSAAFHQRNFRLSLAQGEKLIAANATFAPIGFEGLYLLVPQFPHPSISGGEAIDVPLPGGGVYAEQAPIDTRVTGAITFMETAAGSVKQFAQDIINVRGGYFDARIYEGTPDRHTRSYLLERCFFKLDPSDRDWENRAQVLRLSGTLTANYFGQDAPGNI